MKTLFKILPIFLLALPAWLITNTAWGQGLKYYTSSQVVDPANLNGTGTYTVECWGAGAGGGTGNSNGGGGGAYACSTLTLTSGTIYAITVGTGGAADNNGKDSEFKVKGGSSIVLAKGGSKSTVGAGGAGGASASCVGSTKNSGGNGGTSTGDGGGGGGVGGNAAAGGNGANVTGGTGKTGITNFAGDGAKGLTGGGTGSMGHSFGGGGSGQKGYTKAGGDGANGLVRIYWGSPSLTTGPTCGGDTAFPAPNDACGSAPTIRYDGAYCGNTTGWNSSYPTGNFCSGKTVENNGFFKFKPASTGNVTFRICCDWGCTGADMGFGKYYGIQALLYTSAGSCTGAVTERACISQLASPEGNAWAANGCGTITYSCTAGTTYYLMIDGHDGGGTVGDQCPFIVNVSGLIVLPIELTSFTAQCSPNSSSILFNWVTASELNNNYFTLQHSTGNEVWQDVATVPGKGTTTQANKYSYKLPNQYTQEVSYFRLKQTDYDGQFTYSQTVPLHHCANYVGEVKLLPNPVQNELTAQVTINQEGYYTFSIISVTGAVVQKQIYLPLGANTVQLDEVKDLTPGFYMLQISNAFGKDPVVYKIIKQ